MKLGILLSGRGSNLFAILQAIKAGFLPAEVVIVGSNNPDALGLKIAQEAGIPTFSVPVADYPTARLRDRALAEHLSQAGAQWVVLAGYMRVVGEPLLSVFLNRIINLHPSLLPSFKGLHPHQQALDAGVKFAGCTTHLVDETLDGGPILMQACVPVLEGDTVEALSARVLVEEHKLYPETLRRIALGEFPILSKK